MYNIPKTLGPIPGDPSPTQQRVENKETTSAETTMRMAIDLAERLEGFISVAEMKLGSIALSDKIEPVKEPVPPMREHPPYFRELREQLVRSHRVVDGLHRLLDRVDI